jgi:hypothetical protein
MTHFFVPDGMTLLILQPINRCIILEKKDLHENNFGKKLENICFKHCALVTVEVEFKFPYLCE